MPRLKPNLVGTNTMMQQQPALLTTRRAMMALTPHELVASNPNVGPELLDALRKQKWPVVKYPGYGYDPFPFIRSRQVSLRTSSLTKQKIRRSLADESVLRNGRINWTSR
ncbi:hypothetical protein AV540_00225 [Brevibacillus parabrevis]|nr:hypothetical protein AV540_00225 [Brevibacillus parabrevis]